MGTGLATGSWAAGGVAPTTGGGGGGGVTGVAGGGGGTAAVPGVAATCEAAAGEAAAGLADTAGAFPFEYPPQLVQTLRLKKITACTSTTPNIAIANNGATRWNIRRLLLNKVQNQRRITEYD